MYNFEKLKAWQEAMMLAKMSYGICQRLPKEEKFALIDQLKRAVTSISLNIAEGSGGGGPKVFASFLEISIRSLYETIAIFKLIESLFNIDCKEELLQCDLVNKILHGLLKSVKSSN